MSRAFPILSRTAIKAWLAGIRVKGKVDGKSRDGVTLRPLARHLDWPYESLRALVVRPKLAGLGRKRIYQISRVIHQIETGQLIFVREGCRKVARFVDPAKAKPAPPRFTVTFGPGGVRLGRVVPLEAVPMMPTFKDLVLPKRRN